MQIRRVCRVNADFNGLQPVGVPQAFKNKTVTAWRGKAVKGGQWRGDAVFIAEPSKQHATFFKHWVAALLDSVAQLAGGTIDWRLGRRL